MKITIRDNAVKHSNVINQAIEIALGFLSARYGWQFDNVELIFSTTLRGSSYWRNNKLVSYSRFGTVTKFTQPNALIHVHHKLYTYKKKTLGVAATGSPVGYLITTTTAIIHELTHHVQYNENRNKGELETTENELRWLQQHDPEWYSLLTKI